MSIVEVFVAYRRFIKCDIHQLHGSHSNRTYNHTVSDTVPIKGPASVEIISAMRLSPQTPFSCLRPPTCRLDNTVHDING